MKNHYHPPRCRSSMCISDEWIKYMAGELVRRAEYTALINLKQDRTPIEN